MVTNLLADFSLGTIADIVVGVVAIIIIIINISKGFVKQIVGFVATLLAGFLAYLFCKSLAEFVGTQFGWQEKLSAKILESFSKKDIFNALANEESIKAAVASIGLPDFAGNLAVRVFEKLGLTNINVGQFLADTIARYLLTALSFVVLFIVIRLLLALVKLILLKIIEATFLNEIDKLLALLLGIIKTAVIVYVVVYLIQLLPGGNVFIDSLKTAVNDSVVVKILNGSGFVEKLLKYFLGL